MKPWRLLAAVALLAFAAPAAMAHGVDDPTRRFLDQVKGPEIVPFLLLHSTRFVLMDATGRGRAFYMPLEDDEWLGKVLNDIKTVRGETAR